jgi:hypothetical protein
MRNIYSFDLRNFKQSVRCLRRICDMPNRRRRKDAPRGGGRVVFSAFA